MPFSVKEVAPALPISAASVTGDPATACDGRADPTMSVEVDEPRVVDVAATVAGASGVPEASVVKLVRVSDG